LPDPNKIRAQLTEKRDQIDWGPNRPSAIRDEANQRDLAGGRPLIPADRLRFGADVMEVDAAERQLTLTTGESIAFDTLISSMPVDTLIDALKGSSPDLFVARLHLRHSAVHVVGIGLEGPKPEAIGRKCWMCFLNCSPPIA
jgi:protoporphyrinogen oxidase